MAKRRPSRSTSVGAAGGNGKAVLGFFLGAGAAAGAGYLYLHSTPPKLAPEASVVTQPVPATPSRSSQSGMLHPNPTEAIPPSNQNPPFGPSEDVFEAGARLYSAQCASCHGTPGKDAAMTSPGIQLWREARLSSPRSTTADLYAKIAAGAPDKGMPAYAHTLTQTQMWQLALLLKSTDQDLPDPVVAILNRPGKAQRSE